MALCALLGSTVPALAADEPDDICKPGVCRRVQVSEDRTASASRTLDLFVVRLPAFGPGPAAEPVFFLAGGPGEAASDYASDLPELLAALHRSASLGIFLSIFCSEAAPFVDPAAVQRLAAGTFFGGGRTLSWLRACAEWPRADVPTDLATPVRAATPVLLLSGRLDPVTPPYWGEQVAAFLPNARQILFAASSHFPDSPCASELVARFLDAGSTAGLDARCAAAETRPPFLVR
jgi:pimeloyl-ACP methyl ester carboxylesterase